MQEDSYKIVQINIDKMEEILELLKQDMSEKDRKALKIEFGACLCKIKFSYGSL